MAHQEMLPAEKYIVSAEELRSMRPEAAAKLAANFSMRRHAIVELNKNQGELMNVSSSDRECLSAFGKSSALRHALHISDVKFANQVSRSLTRPLLPVADRAGGLQAALRRGGGRADVRVLLRSAAAGCGRAADGRQAGARCCGSPADAARLLRRQPGQLPPQGGQPQLVRGNTALIYDLVLGVCGHAMRHVDWQLTTLAGVLHELLLVHCPPALHNNLMPHEELGPRLYGGVTLRIHVLIGHENADRSGWEGPEPPSELQVSQYNGPAAGA